MGVATRARSLTPSAPIGEAAARGGGEGREGEDGGPLLGFLGEELRHRLRPSVGAPALGGDQVELPGKRRLR